MLKHIIPVIVVVKCSITTWSVFVGYYLKPHVWKLWWLSVSWCNIFRSVRWDSWDPGVTDDLMLEPVSAAEVHRAKLMCRNCLNAISQAAQRRTQWLTVNNAITLQCSLSHARVFQQLLYRSLWHNNWYFISFIPPYKEGKLLYFCYVSLLDFIMDLMFLFKSESS